MTISANSNFFKSVTLTSLLFASQFTTTLHAEEQNLEAEKPQVMMIGVFHFSNPGLDKVKIKQMNPMDPAPQKYLGELSARIATKFKPTLILLEYQEKDEEKFQGRYQEYLKGGFKLPVNEVYQLGFRIAKMAGGAPIQSFDDRSVGWDSEGLFKVMPTEDPVIFDKMNAKIKEITADMEKDQQTLSMGELLKAHNTDEADKMNKGFYLLTNPVGSKGNHEGAIAASSWWHRNFRMYAKVQRAAKAGERVLVIAGQGHTAILKDFLKFDSEIKAVDITPLL